MHETHILETKNIGLYTWRGGGRGSEKVYCLCTHENVDIFGWPLIVVSIENKYCHRTSILHFLCETVMHCSKWIH